ncbi:MAG TPA: FAD-binding oxidoreductase [Pyrinomonadaceae bacterium]|nr:FAD-binding oxidoreductase [Pyrinomonadaceae bacterium]
MPLQKRVETKQPLSPAAPSTVATRSRPSRNRTPRFVNDVHSQLNRTRVSAIHQPDSIEALQRVIRKARARTQAVSIAGGRHAMGGQQFGTNTLLLDMSRMNRVLGFCPLRQEVEVEAGIQWPELINYLIEAQRGSSVQWGVIQKQTGADRLSLGGALAANIHGRGLNLKPIIDDVEAFVLVDAEGQAHKCSRQENNELFRLAIGGYGLFGVVAHVTLRLQPRRKLERVVRVADLRDLAASFEERIRSGFLYGDFQFMTDGDSDGFLRRGIFSCYRPAPPAAPLPPSHRELSPDDWKRLLHLAHTDRKRAFEVYSSHYLATDGQLYWSDTHQLSVYLDDYHRELDERLGARGSEMITEVYVPREQLAAFMETTRADFRAHHAELIYGTIRLIEKDDESFLAWAGKPYACVVFNLHVEHTPAGIEKAKEDFRRLIERAIEHHGNFYLTYHRWATREQVLSCYPQIIEFLRLKRKYDPAETFQSDWYRHYKAMFSDEI